VWPHHRADMCAPAYPGADEVHVLHDRQAIVTQLKHICTAVTVEAALLAFDDSPFLAFSWKSIWPSSGEGDRVAQPPDPKIIENRGHSSPTTRWSQPYLRRCPTLCSSRTLHRNSDSLADPPNLQTSHPRTQSGS
jgi:hypothetical protein